MTSPSISKIQAELDTLDDLFVEHKVDYLAVPDVEPVPFELWETLAYDIALNNAPIDHIARAYNLSFMQISVLKDNPTFKRMLAIKEQEVAQLGSNADFAVKMRMIANKGAKKLLERIMCNGTSDKDFATLYKQVVQLAQLEPTSSGGDGDDQPTGVLGGGVTFNLYSIPGLEHLQNPNLPAAHSVTIDVTPHTQVPKGGLDDLDEMEAL